MDPALGTQLALLALVALYWYADVPRGYRRWAVLIMLFAFPLVRETPVQEVRLAFGGALTTGTVLSADCLGGKNHHDVRLSYRFLADGASYTGSGLSGTGNPGCGRIAAGDPVTVRYLPAEPQVSAPRAEPLRQLLLAMLGWALLVAAITWLKSEPGVRLRSLFSDMGFGRR
jgi:hypothetical protein